MIRLLVGLTLALAQSGTAGGPPPPLRMPATLRVGLSSADARVLVLSAANGIRVVDAESRRPVWRERYAGDVRVVRIGGDEPRLVYSVQVGSFADEARARELARAIGPRVGSEARVHFDPDRHVWRVRLGAFAERGAAAPLIEALSEAGQPQAWVASEALPGTGGGAAALRLVDRDFEEHRLGARRLVVLPAGEGLVTVNGRRYRGHVEVFIDRVGRLRAVNEIPFEEYLRGVVPEEMGPKIYNELEALKAQAVAARTYAVRNVGQFAADGFDLCDTPRCQVYGGADSEQPLTDEAIAATRGEILTFQGRPINALFSSTCGGHTEDVRNVFGEQDEPYLRGVPCAPEAKAVAEAAGALDSRPTLAPLARTPRLARAAARLRAAGVLSTPDFEDLLAGGSAPLDTARWRAMLGRLAPRLGRADLSRDADERRPLTRGAAAADLVALLDWEDRLARLLRAADWPALAGAGPGGSAAIVLLVREGILDPAPSVEEEAGDAPLPAHAAALALGRLIDRYASDLLEEVRVVGAAGDRLRTRAHGDLILADGAALFLAVPGADAAPVARLQVARNDPLLVHRDGRGRLDYVEALRPFRGMGDDRTSNLSWWEVRLTRGEAEARLARTLGFGDLVDLEVVERGVSGRVAALDVLGTRRTIRLEGFGVRSALDLNDTLFTIERERDEAGRVRGFVFAGRGWGHGVGLCQIGGYGMALRGRSHAEILSRYYPGAALVRLPAAPAAPQARARHRRS